MTSKKTFKRHRDYGFWDQDLRLSNLTHIAGRALLPKIFLLGINELQRRLKIFC
jgi:hypothetical protein